MLLASLFLGSLSSEATTALGASQAIPQTVYHKFTDVKDTTRVFGYLLEKLNNNMAVIHNGETSADFTALAANGYQVESLTSFDLFGDGGTCGLKVVVINPTLAVGNPDRSLKYVYQLTLSDWRVRPEYRPKCSDFGVL